MWLVPYILQESHTFTYPIRLLVHEDKPLKELSLWQPVLLDQGQCLLNGAVQQVEVLYLRQHVPQYHAEEWIFSYFYLIGAFIQSLLKLCAVS